MTDPVAYVVSNSTILPRRNSRSAGAGFGTGMTTDPIAFTAAEASRLEYPAAMKATASAPVMTKRTARRAIEREFMVLILQPGTRVSASHSATGRSSRRVSGRCLLVWLSVSILQAKTEVERITETISFSARKLPETLRDQRIIIDETRSPSLGGRHVRDHQDPDYFAHVRRDGTRHRLVGNIRC